MSVYEGMLRKDSKPGKINYYPISSKKEWDELSDLYKVMEWESVRDPHHNGELRAVKSVIFDVPYMEPYGSRAEVSVHPQEVQKILFCNFEKSDCHLYSVCGVELEGGTRLGAKWLQDSVSGSFAIVLNNGSFVARQGGFGGYVPEHVKRLEDGTFKYDFLYNEGKTTYYELSNPFNSSISHDMGENSLKTPGRTDEYNIQLNARLGVSLNVSVEELNTLKREDEQSQKLLLGLIQSERVSICGDTYFPEPWNREYLSEELNFDLPTTKLAPQKEYAAQPQRDSLSEKINSAASRTDKAQTIPDSINKSTVSER